MKGVHYNSDPYLPSVVRPRDLFTALEQDTKAEVDQPLGVAAAQAPAVAVPHQIDHRIEVEAATQAQLVPCAEQPGEPGVSDIEAVVEVERVAADPKAALEVESGRALPSPRRGRVEVAGQTTQAEMLSARSTPGEAKLLLVASAPSVAMLPQGDNVRGEQDRGRSWKASRRR